MNTEKTKKVKNELTPEELAAKRAAISAARSAAARASVAIRRANAKGRAPMKTLSIREPDYNVIVNWAAKKNVSIAESLHIVAEQLVKNDPSLR